LTTLIRVFIIVDMPTHHIQKKPAHRDWHRADIKCALEKAGWSLRRLNLLHYGTDTCAITHAFRRPYLKAERIIAEALNLRPQDIWPSRYDADGNPLHARRGEHTTSARARNVHERGAR